MMEWDRKTTKVIPVVFDKLSENSAELLVDIDAEDESEEEFQGFDD